MSDADRTPRRRGPRKSHLVVMLGSLAAGAAAAVTLLDSWEKVLVDLGLKQSDTFVLAQQNAQGDLVRQMTRLLSQRLFWVDRYAGDVADGLPQEDQDEAWKQYNDSVVQWNENYMINVVLTEKYLGETTKTQLADLNWLLHRMNTCLNKIHYRSVYEQSDPACHLDEGNGGSQAQNIAVLSKTLDRVNKAFGGFLAPLSK